MKPIEKIKENLIGAIDKYENLPLDDVIELSEILRTLDVNLSHLVFVRDEFYKDHQSVYFQSKGTSSAAKNKEADQKVPELDLTRKILKHFGDTQSSIRSQISLRKTIDR